jgi:hypothetical protein
MVAKTIRSSRHSTGCTYSSRWSRFHTRTIEGYHLSHRDIGSSYKRRDVVHSLCLLSSFSLAACRRLLARYSTMAKVLQVLQAFCHVASRPAVDSWENENKQAEQAGGACGGDISPPNLPLPCLILSSARYTLPRLHAVLASCPWPILHLTASTLVPATKRN